MEVLIKSKNKSKKNKIILSNEDVNNSSLVNLMVDGVSYEVQLNDLLWAVIMFNKIRRQLENK